MKIFIKSFGYVLGTLLAISPLIGVIYIGIWFSGGASLYKAYNHMCDNNISYENKEYILYCAERKYGKELGMKP